jgi:hypothetical protein
MPKTYAKSVDFSFIHKLNSRISLCSVRILNCGNEFSCVGYLFNLYLGDSAEAAENLFEMADCDVAGESFEYEYGFLLLLF